jgi:hypothetical protein
MGDVENGAFWLAKIELRDNLMILEKKEQSGERTYDMELVSVGGNRTVMWGIGANDTFESKRLDGEWTKRKNGKRHCATGPAIMRKDDSMEWWFDGEHVASYDPKTKTFDTALDLKSLHGSDLFLGEQAPSVIVAAQIDYANDNALARIKASEAGPALAEPAAADIRAWKKSREATPQDGVPRSGGPAAS